jgi:hypothetical protein
MIPMLISETLLYPPSMTHTEVGVLIDDIVTRMKAKYPKANVMCAEVPGTRSWHVSFTIAGETFVATITNSALRKNLVVEMPLAAKHFLFIPRAKQAVRDEWTQALKRSGR